MATQARNLNILMRNINFERQTLKTKTFVKEYPDYRLLQSEHPIIKSIHNKNFVSCRVYFITSNIFVRDRRLEVNVGWVFRREICSYLWSYKKLMVHHVLGNYLKFFKWTEQLGVLLFRRLRGICRVTLCTDADYGDN